MPELKQRIARQFSRAATMYDRFADIQADIAFDALSLLPGCDGTLLDIGCGTSRYAKQLLSKCSHMLGVDLAYGMLSQARDSVSNADWICADAEDLPLAAQSVNGVFSSMALQWCSSAEQAMLECARVMRPGARGTLAIMSAGSFTELHKCRQMIDGQLLGNRFFDSQHWHSAAEKAGLRTASHTRAYTSWHPDILSLLNSIRHIGASTLTQTDHRPLNRRSLLRLEHEYEQHFAKNGRLPLTYNVTFLQVIKNHE
ncbi:methyltransferase domain-containing protein [Aestuariibacter salexigens]|uniref:methyltransferase domain-containing protein n=1 Tax=Aestuariibacter salexigens TaxID=226010 RepID=UPI0003FE1684|nr:methyltransferase domain-containing protein [Aestuariibacter salexigens]